MIPGKGVVVARPIRVVFLHVLVCCLGTPESLVLVDVVRTRRNRARVRLSAAWFLFEQLVAVKPGGVLPDIHER